MCENLNSIATSKICYTLLSLWYIWKIIHFSISFLLSISTFCSKQGPKPSKNIKRHKNTYFGLIKDSKHNLESSKNIDISLNRGKMYFVQYVTERDPNANMRYMHKQWIGYGKIWKALWDIRTFSTTTRTPKANIRFFFCCLLVKWEKEKVIFKKRELKTFTELLKRKIGRCLFDYENQ